MATLDANSFPNVDHDGILHQSMSDKGLSVAPAEISAAAQASVGIGDHIDVGENATKTNTPQPETQNEPIMLNETYGGSTTAVEISSNDNPIPRQDELAGKSVPSEKGDKNPDPPPPPREDEVAGLYHESQRSTSYLSMMNWIASPGPGRNAVFGLFELVRGVDERLQIIEKKLHTNQETIKDPHNEVIPPDETGSADPNNVRTEVKFFEAGVEDFYQDGSLQDNATDYGRFSSSKDHPQVLRVLYNKLSDHKTIDKINPDPAQIDIIYLSILSEPISSFFRDVLGLDCGPGYNCIRFSKPFRPLIRNLKPLRDHLANLRKACRNLELNQKPEEVTTGTSDEVPSVEGDIAAKDETAEPVSTFAVSVEDISPDSPEQLEKSFRRPSSLSHFKAIVGFVEQYLDKSVATYENLKSGRDDKVAFENLWMLFDAGTTIYCPYRNGAETFYTYEALSERTDSIAVSHDMTYTRARSSPQAYCVLAARGGVPLKKSLMPGGIEEDDEENDFFQNIDVLLRWEQLELLRQRESPGNRKDAAQPALGRQGIGGAPIRRTKNAMSGLIIACFSIEYDGYRYGPQRELFEIKPYDGLKDVRSMEIFPVKYLNDSEMGRLLQRGRKFVDLANNAHMSYEGTTAGKARETINSDVIVDFKIAFEQGTDLPDVSEIKPIISNEIQDHWPVIPSRGQVEVHDWYEHDAVEGDEVVIHRWCYEMSCQKPTYYAHQDAQGQKVLRKLWLLFDSHASPSAQTRRAREELKLYLEESNLMGLFPGVVPGYALRNRKWGTSEPIKIHTSPRIFLVRSRADLFISSVQLDLDRLQVIHHGDEWNNLVLPKGHREMVQAMVESYTKRSDGSQPTHNEVPDKIDLDLVRGKGKGCIILLHGAPGVGKTSTAECVAAYTKRPLYPITCGDIGHLPEVVEANLEKHFKLAHKWACVLLLDEADVFLAKRTKTDVKRNGLVSGRSKKIKCRVLSDMLTMGLVFLRILEYYPGILFLTTNRVGAIDDAFRSRLHLTLYYPKLVEKQSIKIWKNNIKKLKEVNEHRVSRGQLPIKYDKNEIIKWVKLNWENLQWNGRQIRNAFQTAIALAEFKAQSRKSSKRTSQDPPSPDPKSSKPPVLNQDTFLLIAEASNQFNDYLLQTHGQDEETTASRDQMRPANFKMKPTRIKRVESSESDTNSDSSSHSDSGTESDESDVAGSSDSDSETEKKTKKAKKMKKGKKAKANKSKDKAERDKEDGASLEEEGEKKKKRKKKSVD
ncbi:Putative AAA+ ATPase domain, ATPase, AAA-type, core [Colletotrichum destructivum]|uniref:AAA+ ATPase domain, ATPase, AAA-type, core n=1 Tax=Colletotrichum destructivum TaxID=34406 RepID=A0AAX4IBQ3_9PEZI|nr:Putative AAA+ ATPase domain, ATPase, AAA-type, core [Colletotrichum destructivum]